MHCLQELLGLQILPRPRRSLRRLQPKAAMKSFIRLLCITLLIACDPSFTVFAGDQTEEAAGRGDAAAQQELASDYYFGFGGRPKNYAKAFEWAQKSAAQGNAVAQEMLGSIYSFGLGMPVDSSKAAHWYLRAAVKGQAAAQLQIAIMFVNGEGVLKDDIRAFEWFQKAAMQGFVTAQTRLGTSYLLGSGTPQDFVRAYAWLNLAASQNDNEAADLRKDISRRMTAQQIADGQKLSAELAAKVPRDKNPIRFK
jgi:TPR repeat protein